MIFGTSISWSFLFIDTILLLSYISGSSLKGTLMRAFSSKLAYLPIDTLVSIIDGNNGMICGVLLEENRALFERVRGSTHNHQTWDGGYIDHITDCMNFGASLYGFIRAFGRPLPFSLSDILLVLFLHDIEKPWRIYIDADGTVRNREGLDTKEAYVAFREAKFAECGLTLSPEQKNALKYVEGEYKDYSSTHRVMNELAAFCHLVDTWSARGWYDYPKATGDEWIGAGRFRSS